jgi:hypothetical protein
MRRKLNQFIVDKCEFVAYKQRTTNYEPRASGLTITEVVVASALLVIAIVPILKALTSAHVTAAIIERKTRSLTLAQVKLDDIKARSIYNYGSSFTVNNTSLDGSYLCNVQDTGAGTDLRTITVSVGYDLNGNDSLESGEVEVTLATLLAKRWL